MVDIPNQLDKIFVNQKHRLVGTLFTIYKHFGDFVKCILRLCRKFSEHRQAKVRRFLGICLHDYFIYRTNFVFRNKTPSWLQSQNGE